MILKDFIWLKDYLKKNLKNLLKLIKSYFSSAYVKGIITLIKIWEIFKILWHKNILNKIRII
jgi:hypothetical protein